MTCWSSLPVVRKLKQTLVYIGLLNFLPLGMQTKFLTVLGDQIPSGQQIKESVVLPTDVLHSDLTFPPCLQENKFPQASLQEWVSGSPCLHPDHRTEVVTQHCDFLPREKFSPYLQSNCQGQHLQAVYVHTQCLNALGECGMEIFPLTPTPGTCEAGVTSDDAVRIGPESFWNQGYPVVKGEKCHSTIYVGFYFLWNYCFPQLWALSKEIEQSSHEHSTRFDANGHKLQDANEALCLLFWRWSFRQPALQKFVQLPQPVWRNLQHHPVSVDQCALENHTRPGLARFLDGLSGPTILDDFSKLQESCGGSPLHLYSSEIIQVVGDIDAIFLCYICYCVGDALAQICREAKAHCQGLVNEQTTFLSVSQIMQIPWVDRKLPVGPTEVTLKQETSRVLLPD